MPFIRHIEKNISSNLQAKAKCTDVGIDRRKDEAMRKIKFGFICILAFIILSLSGMRVYAASGIKAILENDKTELTSGDEVVVTLRIDNYEEINKLGYPVFVKPTHGGSSVATFMIKEEKDIAKAVEEGFKWDNEVMIEKFIKGDEITCPVLGNEMFPVIAIKPSEEFEFFDFTSKYADGGAEEVVVQLDEELHKEVEKMALDTFNVLKCDAYARVDMIVTSEGTPYILEVNTLPGMTKASLFPKSAAGKGMEFNELLDSIINESLKIERQIIVINEAKISLMIF